MNSFKQNFSRILVRQKALLAICFVMFGVECVQGQDAPNKEQDESLVYTIVEVMPQYKGGREALSKYLSSNTIYTEEAKKAKISGTTYVTFMVDTTGKSTDPKILRSIHANLDSIVIDIIERMPDWIPGMQRGKKVRVQYNLPVVFSLTGKGGFSEPEPSKYWSKKGKKKFYKHCSENLGKPLEVCDCRYNYIIWNYNSRTLEDLNPGSSFEASNCE